LHKYRVKYYLQIMRNFEKNLEKITKNSGEYNIIFK